MAERQDLKMPFAPGHKRKLPDGFQIIKSRNSPRSRYVRDFQRFSKIGEISVQRNIVQELDLATAFRGLSFINIKDSEQLNRKSPQPEEAPYAFPIDSPEPSPTTTEEIEDLLELEDITDTPDIITNELEEQCDTVSSSIDSDTSRKTVSPIIIRKRRRCYNSYSQLPESPPSSFHYCCHKRQHRDTWSGCPQNIEK